MIYTSYIAKLNKLPEGHKVLVTRFAPKHLKPRDDLYIDEALAPSSHILLRYKQDNDWDAYVKAYHRELEWMDAELDVIRELAEDQDVFLLCYETPDKPCHRHLIAEWYNKKGIPCKEWSEEDATT